MVVLSGGVRAADVGHAPAFSPADLLRVAAYRAYLDFYNGAQWEGAPSPNERRLTFNYARVFVNKAAAYLMGRGVGFAVEAPEGSGEEGRRAEQHAEMLLSTTYERNALALVDLDTAVDSAVLGDGAFKVTWDAEAGEARVTAVDPAGLTCERQADDYRRLLKVRHSYASGESGASSAVMGATVPQVAEEWTAERVEIWRNGRLQGSMANPYGFIPYVIFPNLRVPKEPWGQSDLGREQAPTEAQLRGLRTLLDWLCRERTDIPATPKDVWGHRECTLLDSDKLCPGNLLPWVQAYRFGAGGVKRET